MDPQEQLTGQERLPGRTSGSWLGKVNLFLTRKPGEQLECPDKPTEKAKSGIHVSKDTGVWAHTPRQHSEMLHPPGGPLRTRLWKSSQYRRRRMVQLAQETCRVKASCMHSWFSEPELQGLIP